jgi:hypothetical protein
MLQLKLKNAKRARARNRSIQKKSNSTSPLQQRQFFKRRNRMQTSLKRKNKLRINTKGSSIDKETSNIKINGLASPQPSLSGSFFGIELVPRKVEIKNLFDKLDLKVQEARYSRFSGLNSPMVLKRKSKNVMCCNNRTIDSSSLLENEQTKDFKMDSLKMINFLSPEI